MEVANHTLFHQIVSYLNPTLILSDERKSTSWLIVKSNELGKIPLKHKHKQKENPRNYQNAIKIANISPFMYFVLRFPFTKYMDLLGVTKLLNGVSWLHPRLKRNLT